MSKNFLLTVVCFVFLFIICPKARASKLVNTSGDTAKNTARDTSGNTSDGTSSESFKEAEDGMTLRKLRRVAIGLQAVGDLGFGGALLELNFDPAWGFRAGFGGGEGIQTYSLGAKYILGGDKFLPYLGLDFSHWSTVGKTGPIDHTNPSIISDHLLTADERAAGSYQKNFLVPAFGVQYMQLNGDWAGSSVFAEVDLLMDVGDFLVAPTWATGFLYYF